MAKQNPPSAPMLGADILVEALVRQGIDVIWAYPGGASMPIHQSLTRYEGKIRTILPRYEQGGGFAAQGYARASGKVSACLATSGPGALNFVTVLADAKMDSIPLICITGQVSTKVIGTDAFQETPIIEVARGITKHHYLVTRTEDIARVVKEAVHIATTGRPGPVIIDMPKDVQQRAIVPNFDEPMNLPGYKPTPVAKPEQLDQVMALLRAAKKPVIYAGGGAIWSGASEALREFAVRTKIPVAMTVHGLGAFPADHYLSLEMVGMHGTVYANYAINDADLLLAFGVRFDDRVTGKLEAFCQHGKIVHIDIDPSELNKNKVAVVPIASDLRPALEALNKRIAAEPLANSFDDWHHQIDEWKASDPMGFNETPDAILPQQAIKMLWEIVRDRGLLDTTIVTTGVGQHQMFTAQHWKFMQPRTWFTSGGLGTMGFGLPAAMGAQAAFPDRICIDIDGDGSFLMNIQELATCKVDKLPVKVLLLNNQHLGMVVQWEDRFFKGNRGHTYLGAGEGQPPYPDFVTIAKGFGVAGKQIRKPADLRAALEEMLDTPGCYVLDVLTPHQEHVLPMIPSGMTVQDIIKV